MVTLENIQNQDKITVDKNYKDITTIHEKILLEFDINYQAKFRHFRVAKLEKHLTNIDPKSHKNIVTKNSFSSEAMSAQL